MSLFTLYDQTTNKDTTHKISYSRYQELLKQDLILKAKIYKTSINDYEFVGNLKQPIQMEINGQQTSVDKFSVKIAVVDSAVEEDWANRGITWDYLDGNNTMWDFVLGFLPWIIIIAVYIFFVRWMTKGGPGGGPKGILNFGKNRNKPVPPTEITFKDVAGVEESKFELSEVVDFLKEPEKYQRLGGKIPRGVLLLGPPGTGKTLLARAVAGEAEVPFFNMSGADFVEMFVGVGASRVRDLFENAKKHSPCIVFIDEIDAVGRQRGAGVGGGHDEREQTLNQLLVEMDGFEQNNATIVIAATNRPDVLDSALLRPGRFDRQVVVDRPDIRGREGIFKVHTAKIKIGNDVDLNTLAKATPGLVGADIANIVNEAALLAARRGADSVTMFDFENAKDKVLMGVERKSLVLSDKEKEMTAYHEMGHALVGHFLPGADPLHKVTIIPRGQALGLTAYLPQEEMRSHTRDYILTNVTMMLGGRAAEKLIYSNLTTGASNDIQRASRLVTKMVCEWGMSDKVGPIAYSTPDEEVFLGRDISRRKTHSEKMAQIIDDEIKRILDECSADAEKILLENIDLLHKTAKMLVVRETIEGEELIMLVNGKELPPITNAQLEALKHISLTKSTNEPELFDELIDDEKEIKENKKEKVKTKENNLKNNTANS
ncbi:MAG: ATP-dependent zinc metalloprotease FtsH [Bacteroidetes bacterium]|nr:ATP-dependent zinc metalloprotease FtsH [Bacteroidota bacterium]